MGEFLVAFVVQFVELGGEYLFARLTIQVPAHQHAFVVQKVSVDPLQPLEEILLRAESLDPLDEFDDYFHVLGSLFEVGENFLLFLELVFLLAPGNQRVCVDPHIQIQR